MIAHSPGAPHKPYRHLSGTRRNDQSVDVWLGGSQGETWDTSDTKFVVGVLSHLNHVCLNYVEQRVVRTHKNYA